jgi:hypothetical protein
MVLGIVFADQSHDFLHLAEIILVDDIDHTATAAT